MNGGRRASGGTLVWNAFEVARMVHAKRSSDVMERVWYTAIVFVWRAGLLLCRGGM